MKKIDVYKIDNFLIKLGIIGLLLFFIYLISVTKNFQLQILFENSPFETFVVLSGLLTSAVFLFIGIFYRRKENLVSSILSSLNTARETSIPQMVYSTGYTKKQIIESVKEINKRALGYYIIDGESISDSRLQRSMVLVDTCTSCGNSIGKTYPLQMNSIPHCPYCSKPLDVNHWNELKMRTLENMDGEPDRSETDSGEISIGILIFLIIFFWPGAIIYVLNKRRK